MNLTMEEMKILLVVSCLLTAYTSIGWWLEVLAYRRVTASWTKTLEAWARSEAANNKFMSEVVDWLDKQAKK